MKTKITALIETTLVIVYLIGCAVSTIYVVRSILQAYARAAFFLVVG
ncbi:MAG TPA: hypothetical protein VIB79_11335 [Candidatus Binatia bacterium]|jgi:hypothetical protein